jgi:hypothetical protein
MTRSKREIPHFYLSTTIEMTRAEAWIAAENAQRSVEERLLPIVLLLKARRARACGDSRAERLLGGWQLQTSGRDSRRLRDLAAWGRPGSSRAA